MPGWDIASRAYTQLTRTSEKGRHFAAANPDSPFRLVTYPLGVPERVGSIDDTLVL